MSKTVLLGMNNPLSLRPEFALWPAPSGATGHRLFGMMASAREINGGPQLYRQDYIGGFERRNLLDSKVWSAKDARDASGDVLESLQPGGDAIGACNGDVVRERRIVFVGATTLKCARLPVGEWFEWMHFQWWPTYRISYCRIPHASGRCREYNDLSVQIRAGQLLLEELHRGGFVDRADRRTETEVPSPS